MDKGHGRLERRELTATTELNDFLHTDWLQVAQAFQLRRMVQEKGQTRTETIYGITSLPPMQASPERLLALVRSHWTMETNVVQ